MRASEYVKVRNDNLKIEKNNWSCSNYLSEFEYAFYNFKFPIENEDGINKNCCPCLIL